MSFVDKAKDVMRDHSDQAEQGLDKAGDAVDDKTGNKYSDQIDTGEQKAQEGLDRFAGGGGEDQ